MFFQHLNELHDTLVECWDEDPEARLSAANIVYRMEEFYKTLLEVNEEDHWSNGATTQSQTMGTMATYNCDVMAGQHIGQPTEHSQSSPLPCYSPTDPNLFHPTGNDDAQRQHFFPTSMPHINQGSGCGTGSTVAGCTQPTRAPLGLRHSACSAGEAVQMNVYSRHEPLSVRNSLILGSNKKGEGETNFGVSLRGGASLLYDRILDEIQGENDGSSVGNALSTNVSITGLDVEEFNLNSDSGVQNIHSSSAASSSSESNSNSSESLNSVSSSSLSDELFSKQHLPESSTDTLDLDNSAAASHYGDTPALNTTNELGLATVSSYGTNPVVSTTNETLPLFAPTENSSNSISTVTSV